MKKALIAIIITGLVAVASLLDYANCNKERCLSYVSNEEMML